MKKPRRKSNAKALEALQFLKEISEGKYTTGPFQIRLCRIGEKSEATDDKSEQEDVSDKEDKQEKPK